MAENNEMFEQQNEYPKTIDFDAGIMKKNAAKMLGVAAGISVLMVALTFLMNEPIFYLLRRFGVGCVVIVAVMFVMLLINTGRVVESIRTERDGFYINADFYELDGTKVKIAPFLPFAGKADNIYITVKSGGKKKKYWAGCNEDIHASARRDQVKSELKKLSPDLVK